MISSDLLAASRAFCPTQKLTLFLICSLPFHSAFKVTTASFTANSAINLLEPDVFVKSFHTIELFDSFEF